MDNQTPVLNDEDLDGVVGGAGASVKTDKRPNTQGASFGGAQMIMSASS